MTTLERQVLGKQVQGWTEKNGLTPAVWDRFPEFPPAEAAPVWVAKEPPHYAHFPNPDPILRALSLDRAYVPEDDTGFIWAFVPGADGAVWLVKVKAGKAVGLN